ncbi:2'-5'-oligoadenylate synthase 3-like [Gigantopelta aegis]|uniref:2'-5'-oligoadenylate synthase 3-like n=1 Tax=Gigantopelta aegis TaxID=1735272 RepID=UPI001B88761D|nr:2'-5'-oligoadenylate synthase 3-like [Gigantopelta aegis]
MDEVDRYKEALNTGVCMYRHCPYSLGYDDVKTHMQKYHQVYDCPSCDRSFFLEQALADHIDATEHYFVCCACSEEFVTKDDLSIHIKAKGHNRRQQQGPHVSSSPRTVREEPVLTSFTCSDRSTVSWLSIPIENAPVTFKGHFPNVFKEMEKYKSVTDFIEKVIRPNDKYNRRCEDLVNRLKKFLENNTGLHVKRVFIGGSVGKKTNVMNHSDVDLIVFINDYPTMVEFQRNLDSVLKTLERHVLHDFNWAKEVEHIGTTPYAVQFKAKLKGSTDDVMMHVDLLPALDILDQVRSFKPQHCGRSNHQSSAEGRCSMNIQHLVLFKGAMSKLQ